MFETARRSLGYTLARMHFRNQRDQVIDFTESLASGNRVLLILPLTPSKAPITSLLELFRTRYGEEMVSVVTDARDTAIAGALPRSEIIRMHMTEVTRLFHPPVDILKRVKDRKYDVAVDLNLDFLLPSGYICKASTARIRVGFARPGADLFYNFQIKFEGSSTAAMYDRLASCLKMF